MAENLVTIGNAFGSNSLEGLLLLNDRNAADYLVSDVLDAAPFLAAAYAQISTGATEHKFHVETDLPGVGFRTLNTGRENAAGKIREVIVKLCLMDAGFTRDLAAALGSGRGIEWYMNSEARKSLRAAFASVDRQLIAGVGADEGGFYGLGDYIDKFNPDMQIIKTASAGSSVYMGYFAEDAVSVILGGGGELAASEIRDVILYDAENREYDGLAVTILGWLGLQVAGKYNLARLSNVPQTGDSGLLDDEMLSDLFALFPAGKRPNFILMNRIDYRNLKNSRTATSVTGAPAPYPTSWDGPGYSIPIIVDDNVSGTATVTTTTTSQG